MLQYFLHWDCREKCRASSLSIRSDLNTSYNRRKAKKIADVADSFSCGARVFEFRDSPKLYVQFEFNPYLTG